MTKDEIIGHVDIDEQGRKVLAPNAAGRALLGNVQVVFVDPEETESDEPIIVETSLTSPLPIRNDTRVKEQDRLS